MQADYGYKKSRDHEIRTFQNDTKIHHDLPSTWTSFPNLKPYARGGDSDGAVHKGRKYGCAIKVAESPYVSICIRGAIKDPVEKKDE